jgi:3D (Asp-Asp-Asp) domain-containing protein
MRRSALHLGIPIVCALLGVMLIGASGKADDAAPAPAPLPELAMAVTRTPMAMPAPEPLASPTTRPAAAAAPIELLITTAPAAARAEGVVMPAMPHVVWMEVTAYCPCKKCCGPKAQGVTASGKRVNFNDGLFVAADKKVFDFHTKLKIPGYANGEAVPVLDRGGAIKGNKLDVFFPSHVEALKWGRQKVAVTVVE